MSVMNGQLNEMRCLRILLTCFPKYPQSKCYIVCDFELCFWLCKFVYEVCKKGGDLYPPKNLYQMCQGNITVIFT